jgi:glycosyltransferase involved in cell wall biosynthesis
VNNFLQSKVSILMTAYNREKYIGEAIESVIAQTYKKNGYNSCCSHANVILFVLIICFCIW